MTRLVLALLLATVPACADDLRDDDDPNDPPPVTEPDAGGGSPAGSFVHVDNGDGTVTTTADARDESAWIYLHVAQPGYAEVAPEDPAASDAWELGFQRFQIKVNGGVSGEGGVAVAALEGTAFEAMSEAPADGYVTDEADGDGDGQPDLALGTWYDYDPATHVLTPRDVVYVVRTVGGDYVKLRVEDYYDDAGTSGYVRFRWGAIAPPARSE